MLVETDRIAYDYLIIATGPKPASHEIPGLGPEANGVCLHHPPRRTRTAARTRNPEESRANRGGRGAGGELRRPRVRIRP